MNTFGTLFRISIFGESHGCCVGLTLDGCPAGLPLREEEFLADIVRRQGGGKGTTPRKESDMPIFKTGLFKGKTTGAPLTIIFENNNTRSVDYETQRAIPRPGHADFVAHQKFDGNEDYRGGGHFSGRLTLPLVGAGVIAKKILQRYQIGVEAKIDAIGGITNIDEGLQRAIQAKDSVGGIVSCVATNIPLGMGSPFFESVESVVSTIVFAIPAVRGIEFGTGFAAAAMFGKEHNDAILDMTGKTKTNHAGGVVGGLTNGNDFVFRVAIKPTSSTPQVQESLNLETGNIEQFSIKGRHDLCIALRVPVVLEAVTAIALVDIMKKEQRIASVFQ